MRVAAAVETAAAGSAPDLALFQVAVPLLGVLLLTGVLGETRVLRERRDEVLTRSEKASVQAFAVVVVLIFVGIGVSLEALVDPPAAGWQKIAVTAATMTALLLVSSIGFVPLLRQAMSDAARRRAKRAAVGAVAAGAAAGVFALVGAVRQTQGDAYRVYGTCAAGRCGLNVRSAPTSKSRSLEQRRDGDIVRVVCQVAGERLTTRNGVSSTVWNRLSSGGYVSDLYVGTPRSGKFSPELPGCDDGAPGGGDAG